MDNEHERKREERGRGPDSEQPAEPDRERLFTAGVLTADGEAVTTTDEFDALVETYATTVTDANREELRRIVERHVDRSDLIEPLVELGLDDPLSVAELCTVADRIAATEGVEDEGVPLEDWLGLVPVLRLFRTPTPRTEGAPDVFVPVPAPHLPQLTRIHTPSVVYVWLDDCDPCETVRHDLDDIFAEPQGVMPFAVYGPDHVSFLSEEYEVTAGPALLFVRDGQVQSRIYGAQGPKSIESELSKLRDPTATR